MAAEDRNPMQGVSGPGKFAKRTDLEFQSPEYGAGKQYQEDKSGAPLSKTPDVRGATNTEVRQAAETAAITPLYAPSARSQEDIMHGTDMGPQGGSNVLMMGKKVNKLSDALAAMLPYDETGDIAILYQEALSRGN